VLENILEKNTKMFNNEVSKRFHRLVALSIAFIIFIHEFPTMQGFFSLSAEPTEDLGLEDADDDGSDDESPLAPASGGDQTLSSSNDDEGEDTSDEEMEESDEQSSDAEEGSEDDDDVYVTANVNKSGTITIHAVNFNSFVNKLKLNQFSVP
jgi:hypothetical protein